MSILSVLKETGPHERRAAVSADTVRRFTAQGLTVQIQTGTGEGSGIADEDFRAAGGIIKGTVTETLHGATIMLCVDTPPPSVIGHLPGGLILVGMISPHHHRDRIHQLAARQVTAFAMELMPRISRAQSMDVLSSQANLAGYRAVIEGVAAHGKAVPMMMTAAGTVAPAKVLVLGAGVAGLQAIATARRLGALVLAFDVRPAVKEQVESLGAKFIAVPSEETAGAETAGGYAREMSEDYQRKQNRLIHHTLNKMDIVISTAQIPGRPAPVLITEAMVKDMKPGSVIVDLAVASGGNCPLSRANENVVAHGVTIIGCTNLPSRVAADATPLYARNLYNFVATLFDKDRRLAVNFDDELVRGTLLTHLGKVVHPHFQPKEPPCPPPSPHPKTPLTHLSSA
jgi:NAD(P) transhydrogenase subunit alpha